MNEINETFKESLEKINEVISLHQETLNTTMSVSGDYQEALKEQIAHLELKQVLINNEIRIN